VRAFVWSGTRSWRAGLLAAILVLLATPASAGAHASLIQATPRWGTEVGEAPSALRMVFDEDVVPQYARVAVVAANGSDLAGQPHVTGSVVVVPLRSGQVGSYTVRWRMVASNDGHLTEGAYSFGVRVRPLPPAPVNGLSVPVAPQLLAWIQFLGIVLTGGLLTVRALVWAPALEALGGGGAPDAPVAIWAGVAGAILAVHAGVLAFLTGAYPIVGGGLANFVNTEIEPIRVGTHLGQAWTLMTFAWFGVLMLLVAAWVTPRRRELLLGLAGALALGIAFGLSWASHPASRGGLALIADYVHLLAAALWVGGFAGVALAVAAARSLPDSVRETVARTSIVRFSSVAVAAVAAAVGAGLYLAVRELPDPSALLSTRYGITLLAKSTVVFGALALGGYHRRFVVPRLRAGVPVMTIRRTLLLELGFLLAALALAAILSQTAPRG
jgi:copper transport protein